MKIVLILGFIKILVNGRQTNYIKYNGLKAMLTLPYNTNWLPFLIVNLTIIIIIRK